MSSGITIKSTGLSGRVVIRSTGGGGGGGGSPGGNDTQIQFNDGGFFAGDGGLTFNKYTGLLTVASASISTFDAVPVQFLGTVSSLGGFSGSLTTLADGTPYLIAGDNVSIVTGSNGSITISATSSGTISGVTAGTGLTGGGSSGTVSLSLSSTGSAGTYGSASQVAVVTTDAQGRVTAASSTSIAIDESQVSGLVTDLGNRALTSTSIIAGTGLTGGGNLSTNRTIALSNTGSAGTYGSASQVPVFSTDAQGRVAAATNTSIAIAESQVSGLVTDLGNRALTTTSISAGTGLTGGGDLSTNRTISMPNVGTASTYGSASQVPVFATDAQGRVSSVTNTSISIAESQVSGLTTDLGNRALTTTSISAGTGLTGGGDLSENRTISLSNTGSAGTYGSASHVPVFSTDAQGRVASASSTSIAIAESQVSGLETDLGNRALTTTTITAGTGLTGGGDLSANRTLSLSNTGSAGQYGSASQVPVFNTDAQGRVTAVSNTSIQITETQVTNLSSDLAGKASTSTSITAGTGLTGGGDLSTNRTISLSNTGSAGTYGTSAAVPVFSTDAQGRVTSVTNTSIQITEAQVTNLASDLSAITGSITSLSSSVASEKANKVTTIAAGTGLTGGGDLSANRTLSINDAVVATVSGATFAGAVKFSAGLSGSLTRLTDGTSFLVAGSGISIASASNGQVTVTSTAVASTNPGGSDTYVQFNDGGTSFGGTSDFTFNKTTKVVKISSDSTFAAGNNSELTLGHIGGAGAYVKSTAGQLVLSSAGGLYITGSGGVFVSGSRSSLGTDSTSVLFNGDIFVSGGIGLNDYIQFKPVNTLRIPTNTTASYIYTSGSTNDLYFTQYSGPYTNTTRFRWLESALYTGLTWGGILSASNGGTTFSIAAGEGIIVQQNASTSSAPFPTVTPISWPASSSISLENITSYPYTFVGLDSSGKVVKQNVAWGSTNVNQWDTQIFLGVILHLSQSTVTGYFNSPQISYAPQQRQDDFFRSFGPLKISGHVLSRNSTPSSTGPNKYLGLSKTGGTAYKEGANYAVDPNHPSTVVESSSVTTSKIFRYYMSGSTATVDTNGGAGYTALDPTKYFNTTTGLLTTVPNNEWTLQRVFWVPNSPTNAFIVYYGNGHYADQVTATNAKDSETFSEAPNTAQNAIQVATIVIKESCTDLSTNAIILQSGLFRQVGGVGASGQPTIPVQLSQLGDVNLASPASGDILAYNGATWSNNSTLLSAKADKTTTVSAGTGLAGGGDLSTNRTMSIDNSVVATVSGTTFTGAVKFAAAGGLSGSLTKLADGSSYIVAGGNMSVVTGSAGSITLSTVNSGTIHGVTAGTGLSGGGTSGTVTLSLSSTGSAGTYGSASQVPVFATDAQGRVTSVTNTSISIAESQVSGLTTDLGNRALTTTTISAGSGLTGGGDLSTNRTISMPNVGTASTYGSASQIPVFVTDAQGRVSSVTNTAIAITESQVSGLTTDLGNRALTTTTITAGTGLSGGGDLSTNRTISLSNTGSAGTYGSASQVPVFSTDAQGRVAAATNTSIQITETQVTNLTTDLAGKAATSTSITAGTGLSGGGDLSTNRTISLSNTGSAGTYGSASQVAVVTTDAQGRVTAATNTSIQITESQVTNLTTDLAGKAATSTSITAGTGLTGGGDLTTNRTISLSNTGSAGTYGSASQVPVFSTDAQGRVAAVTNTSIQITESQVTNLTSDLSGKASTSTSITAGTGLTGGGDLSTNRTISLSNTGSAGTYGSATQVPVFSTDAQGRVTAVTNTTVQIAESQVTNLTTDLAGKASTTTSVTAGTGLIGGGDLSTNRTLSINDAVVATVSGSTFTGAVKFNAGLSGSLTQLTNGASYLVAGNNVTITSASNGQITVASTGGSSATPGGSDTYVQFNDGGTTFNGTSDFTFNKTTKVVSHGGNIAVNGGSITTTATTATVFDRTATTVNFAGGASTALNVGHASGTATLSGTLVLATAPTLSNSDVQILTRNSSTGQVDYSDSANAGIVNLGMIYAMSSFNYLV